MYSKFRMLDKSIDRAIKIFMEFFYVSFRKKWSIFGFSNFILEENKNIYGNAFIPWKSHWKIGQMNEWMNAEK